MASSIHESISKNVIIDIPPEYLENGKTLLIEKHFELFVDGYHLSKPSHFIKQIHQLCLIDTQHQDLRSITPTHQLQSDIDENQLVQIIIEFPCETLNNGTSITIEEGKTCGKEKLYGNIEDLYNQSKDKKNINIKIEKESIERGKTILIQKKKTSIIKTNDYEKEQKHHLSDNPFAKRDHLVSKNLMEITIELPPEFFHQGQTITFIKEDPQAIEAKFPYHRPSKPDLQLNN